MYLRIRLPQIFVGLSLVLSAVAPSAGQTPDGDPFLSQYAATYHFTLGQPTAFQVSQSGDVVLYLRSGPRSFVRDLYEFNVATGQERLLAAADNLLKGAAEDLSPAELARRERARSAARGIAGFELSQDGRQVLVPLSGSLYVLDRLSGKSHELKSEAGYPIDARFSPDGKSVAAVRNGDLYVLDVASGAERRLTTGATETLSHGEAEFVAQEEMNRMHGYWWSGDSQRIAYQETDTAGVEKLHIADPAHPEKPPHVWRYPRPGQNNAVVRLGMIAVTGGDTVWVNWNREAYPYLASVRWEKHAPLTILVQNREQTEELLLAVDPTTGKTSELVKESDPAWVNIDPTMPYWFEDGKQFLWSAERNNAWQIELRNRDGGLMRKVLPPDVGYRALAGVDEKLGSIYFTGGADPTQSQLFSISIKDELARPVQLTSKRGLHSAVFGKRGGTHVITEQTAEGKVDQSVFAADGKQVGQIRTVAEQPPFASNVEFKLVADEPRLWTAIIRPRAFDAGRRYPVIVHVYGGPHAQTVLANGRSYLLEQWLADQGFIVVSIDGRGTPARGREFERSIKGNFAELALTDQVRGLEALGKIHPEMDLQRVGIFGWSFGGYLSAISVMRRPDIFQAGIAGAPVVDWRDYDTHYTERYLGLPAKNESGYAASSVLTYADQLRRPLLIIHGTADDNVYFLHSIKLCDALFRAGKSFDFLPLAGYTHMVPDPLVVQRLNRRIADFFAEHLRSGAPESKP